MTQGTSTTLRCANASGCVSHPVLGEPAKLSRGNPGPTCFACEERRVAAELGAASRAKRRGRANGSLVCAERTCTRPATERYGGVAVCREHAATNRAFAILKRSRMWALTCERALRCAIDSGDERLELKWAKLLLEAEARSAWAEAELDAARSRARRDHAG